MSEHVAAFNAAVGSGDWDAFAARFAPDAVMTFAGVPVGPYVGRAAIAAAYRAAPPSDTMTLVSSSGAFERSGGGTGVMTIAFDDVGLVTSLAVSFD